MMHNAACIAAIAFSNASVGVNHALAHAFGARFGVAHGRANALMRENTRFQAVGQASAIYDLAFLSLDRDVAESVAKEYCLDIVEVPARSFRFLAEQVTVCRYRRVRRSVSRAIPDRCRAILRCQPRQGAERPDRRSRTRAVH